MTGAEVIALVSVVVSGVTALTAPWIAHVTAARQLRAQTRITREDELRAVIEHAAIRLTQAIQRLDAVKAHAAGSGPPLGAEAAAEFAVELEQLWVNEDRINVRLGGEAPETNAYANALQEFSAAYVLVARLDRGEGLDREELRDITRSRNQAFEHQREFFNAASRRLNPGDPPRPRKRAELPSGNATQLSPRG